MSAHGTITAARRAAAHCTELVAPVAAPENGLGRYIRLGETLAPLMAARLEPLFMVGAWEGKVSGCELVSPNMLDFHISPTAGNFTLPVGDAGGRLFASFALAPLGERLAHMFGGNSGGEQIDFGKRLPTSVVMLLRRLERALTQSLSAFIDAAMIREDEARFDSDYTKLGCFPAATQAAVLKLMFHAADGAPIELVIACRRNMLGRLLAHFSPVDIDSIKQVPDRISPALCDIPLSVRVQLTELKLPASRLVGLKPGQVLPLSIARAVPLMIEDLRLASGSIGELDDRVAIQIEHLLLNGEYA